MRKNNKITVLITGVDGFVGANLKTYLTQFEQYQIHGLLRHKTDKLQFVNLHYIHDFSDLELNWCWNPTQYQFKAGF